MFWRTTHSIRHKISSSVTFLWKVENEVRSPDLCVSMFCIQLRKLLWVYRPGLAGIKGNDRANRLVGKVTVTNGLHLRRSEVLRNLMHTEPRTSHHQLRKGDACRKRKCLIISLEMARKGICWSDKHWNCFKDNIGGTCERWGGAHICPFAAA